MQFYPHFPIPFGRPPFFLRLENTEPIRIADCRLISCDVAINLQWYVLTSLINTDNQLTVNSGVEGVIS